MAAKGFTMSWLKDSVDSDRVSFTRMQPILKANLGKPGVGLKEICEQAFGRGDDDTITKAMAAISRQVKLVKKKSVGAANRLAELLEFDVPAHLEPKVGGGGNTGSKRLAKIANDFGLEMDDAADDAADDASA